MNEAANVPNDPNDPSLYIEVRTVDAAGEIWHPLFIGQEQGRANAALAKTSQRDRVTAKLEVVYGKGNVRTLPVDGYGVPTAIPLYIPDNARADVTEGPTLPSTAQAMKLCCGMITMHFRAAPDQKDPECPEVTFAIAIGENGSLTIFDAADAEQLVPIWQGDGRAPTNAGARNGIGLIANWLVTQLSHLTVEQAAKLAQPPKS